MSRLGIEPNKRKDYTGQRFHYLTAVKPLEFKRKNRAIIWVWRCDCGKEIEVAPYYVTSGHVNSCGCKKIELKRIASSKPKGVSAFNLLFSRYKQKAKERNLSFEITEDEFRTITKNNCWYCGVPPSQVSMRRDTNGGYVYNGVDRLDNSVGYVLGNCVSCCSKCNRAKGTLDISEFLTLVKSIHDNLSLEVSRPTIIKARL